MKGKTKGKTMLKVLVVGDGGIGKTTWLEAFCELKEKIDMNKGMTIASGFFFKEALLPVEGDGVVEMVFQIWDFAGQEQFRHLLDSFVRGAGGAIVAFDLSRRNALRNLGFWVDLVRMQEEIPIILMGTKADLRRNPKNSDENVAAALERHGCQGYIEISTKEGENIDAPFRLLVHHLSGGSARRIEFLELGLGRE